MHDLRRWTDDVHRTVDDTPYGGGPGMVMRPEPWGRALDELAPDGAAAAAAGRPDPDRAAVHAGARRGARRPSRGCCSPAGATRASTRASRSTPRTGCGWTRSASATTCSPAARWPSWSSPRRSAGCCRACSATPSPPRTTRSQRADGLLEAPAYTKPASWRGLDVPPVLLSGNHAEIARWRAGAVARAHRAAPPGPARLSRSTGHPTVSGSTGACGIIVGLPAARCDGRAIRPVRQRWPPPGTRTTTKEAIPR